MFRKLILNLEHFYIKVYKNMFAVGDVYESGATSFPDDFAFFNFEPQITLERIVSVTTFNDDKLLTFRIALRKLLRIKVFRVLANFYSHPVGRDSGVAFSCVLNVNGRS